MPLTVDQLHQQMSKLDQPVVDSDGKPVLDPQGKQYPSMWHRWSLVDQKNGRVLTEDMKDSGLGTLPVADNLYASVFQSAPIEWSRVGSFQDVSMRLIAERLLTSADRGSTYLQGELTRQQPSMPAPSDGMVYHVCCSPHNDGARALMDEMCVALGLQLKVCEDGEHVMECERFVLYLTSKTWHSSPELLRMDVERAIAANVRLLVVHEMRGMDPVQQRGVVSFSEVLDETPVSLKDAGVYNIAIML